ncbi:hypothetical protein PR202_gb26167 [Eleusine coracana subsp. coracana]|uniref:Uncharacterized protein n=1 Tax=Eleusine coracana subsp. coracana TaxID=191504 RepID=A0AAV5FR52_ELECO|nr:hypothetical protein PR202_gb26139 [Eleusine coracana subsp. coracana]GJN37236.1 hypothetical protein PR202_gb26167 [Eleusine coracana subsp. coracana]
MSHVSEIILNVHDAMTTLLPIVSDTLLAVGCLGCKLTYMVRIAAILFFFMADENKVNETSSAIDAWDMPSLISSVYATPLFRRGLEPINLPGFGDVSNDQPGIVSEGSVFPPSEHENLPIEPDVDELISNDSGKEGSCAGSNDEWCYVTPEEVDEKLSVTDDLPSANETTDSDSKTPESMSRVIGLFSRLKDGLSGGQQIRSLLPTRLLSPQQLSA